MALLTQDQMSLRITRQPGSSADFVRINGDVDVSNGNALGIAARHLNASAPGVIYVDLGGTTFVGSTLLAFLADIAVARGGVRRPVVLCRPTPGARHVIEITALDRLVILRPDLPPLWPDDPS